MLDHAALRRMLPHGYPMLLLDRVTDLGPDARLSAVKAVSGSEPCYRDLPADAGSDAFAYPVSLLVESHGQAAAVLWLWHHGGLDGGAGELPIFAGVRDVRFTGAAYPGDVVRHEVWLDQVVHGTAFAVGEMWVGPRRIATVGSLIATVRSAADLRPGPAPPDPPGRPAEVVAG
jgi:3-hydroxyacyl-[acyl-carrier-protein] dehydratase